MVRKEAGLVQERKGGEKERRGKTISSKALKPLQSHPILSNIIQSHLISPNII